jgi:transaldolase
MGERNYLQWLAAETRTAWWHDSGDPAELDAALGNGAVGVTTNPVLSATALKANREPWRDAIRSAIDGAKTPGAKAESLMRIVVTGAARRLEPAYRRTGGAQGWVCAQVNPALAGDRSAMEDMARRFDAWAPNIAVKLPATAAGLDVMERCAVDGITTTITVSFTVPQVLAAGRRFQEALARRKPGARRGRCFAVVMIGRLDEYLREVCADNGDGGLDEEIRHAGLAVVKRAHAVYHERGYEATLLVAALRGNYHMTDLAGGDLVMSIHPTYQKTLLEGPAQRALHIDEPVPAAILAKLQRVPEFVRAYEPDGLSEKEMLTYGVTQRTISQFIESGWKPLEQFTP